MLLVFECISPSLSLPMEEIKLFAYINHDKKNVKVLF